MRDDLGSRMKFDYEHRARPMLPRRAWTVIRIDGRTFHTYTKGLDRPYDMQLVADMVATAVFVAQQAQGCRLAYVQSDEISLILGPGDSPSSEAWFNGNQQKLTSITASAATARFNQLRAGLYKVPKLAMFDSRAFTISSLVEVSNYCIWRQQDATRNSLQMAAQAQFSHRQLHGKNTGQMQEMLAERGIDWNTYPAWCRHGALIVPRTTAEKVRWQHKATGEWKETDAVRRQWVPQADTPIFAFHREWLMDMLLGVQLEYPTDYPAVPFSGVAS